MLFIGHTLLLPQVGMDNSEKYKSYFTERCIAGAGSDDDDDNYKTINNIINLDLLSPSVAKICTKFFHLMLCILLK